MPNTNRKIQYLAGISASFGFIFVGAALSWPSPALPKFKNNETLINITDAQASWVVAIVTIGAVLGCLAGQIFLEKLGSRKTFFASAIPAIIGSTIIIFATVPELLYFARFLEGCSTGLISVVTMLYLTEIADKEVRGALGMLVQIMNNLGGLLMYCVGPFVTYNALNLLVLAIPVSFMLICIWLPESPYYHLKCGRPDAARKEFMYLKGTKDEKWVNEQLGVIRAHVIQNMENKSTYKELFTNLRYREAIYIVSGLKFLQYMTGSLAIQSYLQMIFKESSSISGPNASIIYGCVQIPAGILATVLIDRFGKRILMIVSSLGVGVSLSMVGIYFFLQDRNIDPVILSAISSLPLIGILGFNIMYTIGIGNIPYVIQAELFPVNVKTVASSTATIAACIFSFTVAKGYQTVKDTLGHHTVFWLFAIVAFAGIVFVYFMVPETKGKTLEKIQDDFDGVELKEIEGEKLVVVT